VKRTSYEVSHVYRLRVKIIEPRIRQRGSANLLSATRRIRWLCCRPWWVLEIQCSMQDCSLFPYNFCQVFRLLASVRRTADVRPDYKCFT